MNQSGLDAEQSQIVELWLASRRRMTDITPEVLKAIPPAAIGRAFAQSPDFDLDVNRLLREHDGLATGEGALALFSEVAGTRRGALLTRIVDRLGELRYAPAASRLLELALRSPPSVHADLPAAAAAQAILKIGEPGALGALAALLDAPTFMPSGAPDPRLPQVVKAAVQRDPKSSFATLGKYLSPESLGTPRGLAVARQVLLTDVELLAQDARWIDVAVQHLDDDRLPARHTLSGLPPERLQEALAKAGVQAAGRPRRVHPSPPRRAGWSATRQASRRPCGTRSAPSRTRCATAPSCPRPAPSPPR